MFDSLAHTAPVRKLTALVKQIPRTAALLRASRESYQVSPPVLCNSFPKSGTHLLFQILEALPGVRSYRRFLASIPSIPFRRRPLQSTRAIITGTPPGELLRAHLFYHPRNRQTLHKRGFVHYFIYRDPRDVVVSEAKYLAHMNRWHRMHQVFRNLPDETARISRTIKGFSRNGFPYWFPSIRERFRAYEQWLDCPEVVAVRFEDLVSDRRRDAVRRIACAYSRRAEQDIDVEEVTERAIGHIDPSRSHTYRKGKTGGWRDAFRDRHKQQMKEVAGDLLIRLGYEDDYAW